MLTAASSDLSSRASPGKDFFGVGASLVPVVSGIVPPRCAPEVFQAYGGFTTQTTVAWVKHLGRGDPVVSAPILMRSNAEFGKLIGNYPRPRGNCLPNGFKFHSYSWLIGSSARLFSGKVHRFSFG